MTKIQDDPQGQTKVLTHTGTMLAPLFTWRGKDIYPQFGASQPVGEPDSEPDDDGDGEEETGTDSGSATDTVSREDFQKIQAQLSAADKNRAAAEKRLKDIEDAKKDELTKATEQVEELTKMREQDAKDIADLRLQNAFLTAETGITWHDSGDALALAERKGYLDGVVVEGKVDANMLATKLKELAKAHSYLVKTENASSEKERQPVRTGSPIGNSKNKQKKADEPDLTRYNRLLQR